MSFDVAFMSCRTSGTEEKTNPFTGETVAVPVSGPLNSKELAAVNTLFAAHDYDSGLVHVDVDFQLEISLDDDLTGGMIFLRDVTPGVFLFMYQLADAGNYVLCPIMEDNPCIVTSAEASASAAAANILEPNATIHVVDDSLGIAELIYPAFGDWDTYRRKVMGDSN